MNSYRVGLILIVSLACSSCMQGFLPARSKNILVTPEQARVAKEAKIRSQEAFSLRKAAAVDLAVRGDYQSALREFEALSLAGQNTLRARLLCLLHLGRGPEGLHLLEGANNRELSLNDRAELGIALSIVAQNEQALQSSAESLFRLQHASEAPDGRSAQNALQGEVHGIMPEGRLVMKTANDFGRAYDHDMLVLVGDEAVRRGATDTDSLCEYASQCLANGELRKGKDLLDRAFNAESDERTRNQIEALRYSARNIIAAATSARTIEEAEAMRQADCRDRFFRSSW